MQRADQRLLAKRHLERVVLARAGAAKRRLGGLLCGGFIEWAAREESLGLASPPRLRRDAAERDARSPHAIAVEIERDRRGGKREFIRFAIAHLQEEGPAGPGARRDLKRGDQFAG